MQNYKGSQTSLGTKIRKDQETIMLKRFQNGNNRLTDTNKGKMQRENHFAIISRKSTDALCVCGGGGGGWGARGRGVNVGGWVTSDNLLDCSEKLELLIILLNV